MSEYFSDRGIWPSLASDVMGTTSGKYVSQVTIVGGNTVTTPVTLEARMKSQGVNAAIASGTFWLVSTDGNSWDCTVTGGSAPVLPKYRPGSCR
jgi:hypothetical protein